MKIKTLTSEQEVSLLEYRERYFRQAVCTEPADKPKAETAVRELLKLLGMEISKVVWIVDPNNIKQYSSLNSSLYSSLNDSLYSSLNSSLYSSLNDSLNSSLYSSLVSSLVSSLNDSLWSSGWIALYSFVRDVLEVKYTKDSEKKLNLLNSLLESCFAVWVTTDGTAIFCDRPGAVEIQDNKLIRLTWKGSPTVNSSTMISNPSTPKELEIPKVDPLTEWFRIVSG